MTSTAPAEKSLASWTLPFTNSGSRKTRFTIVVNSMCLSPRNAAEAAPSTLSKSHSDPEYSAQLLLACKRAPF